MPTVVTTAGLQFIVDKLDETVASATPKWIGSGTGATGAAIGYTVIETETTEARANGTLAQPSSTTLRDVGTITYDSSATIANAGTLSSSSGGTLFIHGNFTGVAVLANDAIQFTVDCVVS